MATQAMTAPAALYQAIRKGPATEAQLRKASKLNQDEFDSVFGQWRQAMWLDVDDSGKEPKYSLNQLGANDLANRYPD